MGKDVHHFEVHPSVVYQLGESLISDAIQALIELVKNSYDADASYAKVVIDTQCVCEFDGAKNSPVVGRIIVEDDGHGMSREDIETGWLTISNRKKRELKHAKQTTPCGRTPLGDKGLGRLGVQRLGDNIEISTKAQGDSGYRFGFSWSSFATAPSLKNVDIHFAKVNFSRPHGTTVVVSGLKESNFWQGQDAIKRLEQKLSQMISPYKEIRDFIVFVEVDGKHLELIEVSDRLRDTATMRYSLDFDGVQIIIQGRARLEFFRTANDKDAEQFALIAESDDGNAFFDFLQTQKQSRQFELTRSLSNPWFVEFRCQRKLDTLDKKERLDDADGSIANPGPFIGEVDVFNLGPIAYRSHSMLNNIKVYRDRIKELSGIRVYRDGFAIRVDKDWLKLGAQWTSAPSWYGLKPDSTLGYVALSARENMVLEETTDREGFKDSPYFRNFYALLEVFTSFTDKVHEFFGRAWVDFRKMHNEALARVNYQTVEDISLTIKKELAKAPQHKKSLAEYKAKLGASVSASKATLSQLKAAKEISPELRKKMTSTLSDLEQLLTEAEEMLGRISEYFVKLESLQSKEQVLEDRFDTIRRQLDDVYQTVALGLTAEALSHEIFNVADQLAQRTKSVQTTLRNKGINDRSILVFLEHVESSVTALRKQISFLSPSLRYVREQRHDIYINEFAAELLEFYQDRLRKNKIAMTVVPSDSPRFLVRMNRGKLEQVIDNLILNSEYWLKEDITQRRLASGNITIEIFSPFVRVFDDGSGIDPSVEPALFEPFISAKKRGRGLGLFIAKQLLDSEGCSIGILPERNQRNRLFKFQIDLRGAIHE
ncbi:MAG: ATP-binding protein [Holophagales bacterium]|jgi:signal transduction histidine kinase|nr:ATP-binding protein [Holophagales bacterium]